MKKELYFVSYSYSINGIYGFGNCEVWKNGGGFDVRGSAREIEKLEGWKEGAVIILFFKKLGTGERL